VENKILVIRGGAIGDFILTLPVLAALRQQFPQTRLEVLGYPHIAQLALAGGLADHVQSIEAGPLAGFFARNGSLHPALQEYFAGFAIIISYLYDPDEVFQSNVARCSKAQFIAGPHRPVEQAGVHATKVFLRPLERLAVFDADPVPRLRVSASPRLPVSPSSPLAVHPGSGSERKNWPEAQWIELLQQLTRTTDLRLLLIGGEAEQDRWPRLLKALPADRVTEAKNLPLRELAQRLASCAAFLGHDSGITHLAAAVGLPTLVLWGESADAIWRPQAEKVVIIKETSGLQELTVSRVLEEFARFRLAF